MSLHQLRLISRRAAPAMLAAALALVPVTAFEAPSTPAPSPAAARQAPSMPQNAPPALVPRFARATNPIALTGPARPSRYMEASGQKAAFLGREDGSFEAWVYPLKVLHDFSLSFGVAAYADPMPGPGLATSVDIRPETSTVRYAHASFTVDATWFVPIDQAGGMVLLDVDTSEPLTIVVKFRPDLKPMWPAALGGQYSYWDNNLKAYVIGEGSGKNNALIGCPLALTPPEQPAHNLPDAPSQFAIRVTPEDAARGLIPIVITAGRDRLDAIRNQYAALLSSVETSYRKTVDHYRQLRDDMLSVQSPDPRLDLAFEWGKVALDKGFVCNPDLGCGLIAGLGPSGTTERPGFGWFFGGDTFINSWAMTGYGDFATVKQSLQFLRKRQRADGKMMHELSQGAGYIRWFEDYGYGYYHADTTALYIVAVSDYVDASGDTAMARDFWPSMRKAYDYCASTDEDGDGLMDNTKAGVAAAETGSLRSRDVLTDVFLASAWTEATAAAVNLARIADPGFVATAQAAHDKARASLNRRFLDDAGKRIYYAVMRDGKGQAEQTVWPAFGIWRGVFDMTRPAVQGMLDELARPGIGADWGARMLSRESKLYDPLGYNNGAAWPFLTGFAGMAEYVGRRGQAGWQCLDPTIDLNFLETRGYVPELFSGDRLRSIDAAVPHQLFATQGFMSMVLQGMLGMRADEGGGRKAEGGSTRPALRLAPQLPVGWRFLHLKNVRWQQAVFDVDLERKADSISVRVAPRQGVAQVVVELPLPAGAELLPAAKSPFARMDDVPAARGTWVKASLAVARPETFAVRYRGGVAVAPLHDPLRVGDESHRLRVIDTRFESGSYTMRVQGLRGRSYTLLLDAQAPVAAIDGAREMANQEGQRVLQVTFPAATPGGLREQWAETTITVRMAKGR
jgi:glycogen debranching enzyme